MGALNVSESPGLDDTPPQIYRLEDQYDQPSTQKNESRSTSSSFVIPANGQIPTFVPMSQRARPSHSQNETLPPSRPTSQHQQRADSQLSAPSVDDPEAFPTLASLNAKRSSKHHGQRPRHGHNSFAENKSPGVAESSQASPSPTPGQRKLDATKKSRLEPTSEIFTPSIAQPQHVPWLETGSRANHQYLKYRQEAIKHGSVRNKFLQR